MDERNEAENQIKNFINSRKTPLDLACNFMSGFFMKLFWGTACGCIIC